jgi:hypothetical protein
VLDDEAGMAPNVSQDSFSQSQFTAQFRELEARVVVVVVAFFSGILSCGRPTIDAKQIGSLNTATQSP